MNEADSQRRVVLITGASRGIGAAIASRMGAPETSLVLAARSGGLIEKLAGEIREAGGNATAVPCDVTDRAELRALVDHVRTRHGRLDVLVNNAAVFPRARRLERCSWEDWDAAIACNLAGPWYLACRAKELMDRGGVIVNIASTSGYYPSVGLGLYNISKAAMNMLTRASALEWAKDNVRVVGVAPGITDTNMAVPAMAYFDQQGLPPNPMGRMGLPAEIADLVEYVTSDRAAFVTGSTFVIDGGELLR